MKFDGMPGCKLILSKQTLFETFDSFYIKVNLPLVIFNGIMFYCRGHNPLDNKTELQKAMEKRSFKAKDKERKVSEESEKTPFQKMLEERAKRLEQVGIN